MDSDARVGENLSFAQALEATYEDETRKREEAMDELTALTEEMALYEHQSKPREEKWECIEPAMNLKESVGYFRDVMARIWGWRHELG